MKGLRLAAAGALAALAAAPVALASTTVISPKDGEIVGSRPNLVFEVDDYNSKMKFTLELSKDRFKNDVQTWDMRKTLRGWSIASDEKGEPVGGDFVMPRPIGEGTWYWRVVVHDNGADLGPDFTASFVVDSSPPAEVDGLQAAKDPESGGVRLSWNPVAIDVNGGSERVENYRIYAYDKKGLFPRGNLKLLGTTDRASFLDTKPAGEANSIAFYRITAVDAVGNESPAPKNPHAAEHPDRERKARPQEGTQPPPKDKPKRQPPKFPEPKEGAGS